MKQAFSLIELIFAILVIAILTLQIKQQLQQ
jgi:prepilin-type N-terminal cleavage/methylation domain-containing protein